MKYLLLISIVSLSISLVLVKKAFYSKAKNIKMPISQAQDQEKESLEKIIGKTAPNIR
jgi:hypothetical protein